MSRRTRTRGVTILETMIAMVILLVGIVGSLAAMQQGMNEARQGQNRQQKLMIADAALQRIRLQDKAAYFALAAGTARPTSDIRNAAVSATPWALDVSTGDALDLSTGSYFQILPDGTITKDTSITAGTACNAVPVGTVCREVVTHTGAPYGTTIGIPSGTQIATSWVRVTRRTGTTGNLSAETEVILSQVVVR